MKKIVSKIVSSFAALVIIISVGFAPATASAIDTGFLSPSSNSANGFGDTWSNADAAYANGGGSATESDGDRHHYYTFNFNIPVGSTINGIEVKTDVWSTDSNGCSFGVDLSWNGGSNWSNQKTTALNGSETTYTFGNSSDSWGAHSWVVNDFTNGNFRARVDSISPFGCTGTRHLDWIRTKVYYTEPIGTEIVALQLTSATPTNTTITELTENFEINLDTHGTNLTIVAETNPATVGSVRFNLDAGAHQKTENIFPYSIMGDLPAGDFDPMPLELLSLGLHSVTATPYSEADMGGIAGDPFTVNFKVIQNEAGRCSDETDNDLDGLTDITDPDCIVEPVDVCSNIEGVQEVIPEGYAESEGICSEIVYQCSDAVDNDEDGFIDYDEAGDPECSASDDNNEGPDMCTNIAGDQASIPDGYHQDGTECSDAEVGDAAIGWIYKETIGLGGAFQFSVNGEGSVGEGDSSFELATEGGDDSDYRKVYLYPSEYNAVYSITEAIPEGWNLTGVSCVSADDYTVTDNGVDVVVDPDDTFTCYFTNTAVAELEIIKNVVNNEGGTAAAGNFNIDITNNTAYFTSVTGFETGTIIAIEPGTYEVTEPNISGYERSYSEECTGSIALGERKTCVVTNSDVEDNTDGGSSSGSEANPSGSVLGASTETQTTTTTDGGKVLGALSCSDLSFEQLISIKNGVGADPEIVKALQEWLNSSQNAGLTVTGIYDEPTKFAIMLLQEKYASEVLSPWGIEKATGNVWKTTAKLIMKLVCGIDVETGALVAFNL